MRADRTIRNITSPAKHCNNTNLINRTRPYQYTIKPQFYARKQMASQPKTPPLTKRISKVKYKPLE